MSRISSKRQVTIPVVVLERAGLHPGDDVEVVATDDGRIELVRQEDAVARYAGMFGNDVYPPGYLDEVRRSWE